MSRPNRRICFKGYGGRGRRIIFSTKMAAWLLSESVSISGSEFYHFRQAIPVQKTKVPQKTPKLQYHGSVDFFGKHCNVCTGVEVLAIWCGNPHYRTLWPSWQWGQPCRSLQKVKPLSPFKLSYLLPIHLHMTMGSQVETLNCLWCGLLMC